MGTHDQQTLVRAKELYEEIANHDKQIAQAYLPLIAETLPPPVGEWEIESVTDRGQFT